MPHLKVPKIPTNFKNKLKKILGKDEPKANLPNVSEQVPCLSSNKTELLPQDIDLHITKILRNTGKNFEKINIRGGVRTFVRTTTDGTWLEIGKPVGNGNFARVNELKRVFHDEGNLKKLTQESMTANKVIKILNGNSEGSSVVNVQDAKKEAAFLRQHGVNAEGVVDKPMIIMDNCGKSLNDLLSPNTSFEGRVIIAKGVVNELLSTKAHGVVHCDVKAKNICYKEFEFKAEVQLEDELKKIIKKTIRQFFLVDFGLASTVDSIEPVSKGTPSSMAPELFEDIDNSLASDMYALAAVLGTIFGAKDVSMNKRLRKKEFYNTERKAYKDSISKQLIAQGVDPEEAETEATIQAFIVASKEPFNFDGICEGYDTGSIDKWFKADLLRLLNASSNNNVKSRVPLEFVIKFLNHISYRIEMQRLQQECEKLASSINLPKEGNQMPFQTRYYESIRNITKKNRFVSDIYNEYLETPTLSRRLKQRAQEFQISLFGSKLTKDNKFFGTNSSGAKKITAILSSGLNPIAKLKMLQRFGKNKTAGISARYSRSHFFGKGRHNSVENLYNYLAKLDVDKVTNGDFAEIRELIAYIDCTTSFADKAGYPEKAECFSFRRPTSRVC